MLEAIYTSIGSARSMISHDSIRVIANKGLENDRYATGHGFYTGYTDWDAHVTMIQQEPEQYRSQ
jgi:hypothetical protein